MNITMRYSNYRLLETEVTLSVINVGITILAIVPAGTPNQTTGLYRLVELVSALIIICTRVIWHLTRLILNCLNQNIS